MKKQTLVTMLAIPVGVVAVLLGWHLLTSSLSVRTPEPTPKQLSVNVDVTEVVRPVPTVTLNEIVITAKKPQMKAVKPVVKPADKPVEQPKKWVCEDSRPLEQGVGSVRVCGWK